MNYSDKIITEGFYLVRYFFKFAYNKMNSLMPEDAFSSKKGTTSIRNDVMETLTDLCKQDIYFCPTALTSKACVAGPNKEDPGNGWEKR